MPDELVFNEVARLRREVESHSQQLLHVTGELSSIKLQLAELRNDIAALKAPKIEAYGDVHRPRTLQDR